MRFHCPEIRLTSTRRWHDSPDLTRSLVAVQELLQRKSVTTTAMHYNNQTENGLTNGMYLLQAASGKNDT